MASPWKTRSPRLRRLDDRRSAGTTKCRRADRGVEGPAAALKTPAARSRVQPTWMASPSRTRSPRVRRLDGRRSAGTMACRRAGRGVEGPAAAWKAPAARSRVQPTWMASPSRTRSLRLRRLDDRRSAGTMACRRAGRGVEGPAAALKAPAAHSRVQPTWMASPSRTRSPRLRRLDDRRSAGTMACRRAGRGVEGPAAALKAPAAHSRVQPTWMASPSRTRSPRLRRLDDRRSAGTMARRPRRRRAGCSVENAGRAFARPAYARSRPARARRVSCAITARSAAGRTGLRRIA